MNVSNSKVALVTGAARRLGRHIALALARQGWDIAVHYRNSATEARETINEIEALGRRAIGLPYDLGNETAVGRLVSDAKAQLGPVSCVVNNASVFKYDSVDDFSWPCLESHLKANAAAPIMLTRAMYDELPHGMQGVAVNLLDQKLFNFNPDFLSYTLSKAALHSATIMLAQALAPKVRVVGVAPGITMQSGDQTLEEFRKAHAMTPLGRSSTPDDIASAVCFVVESPALTGTTVVVDGGQHLSGSARDIMFMTG